MEAIRTSIQKHHVEVMDLTQKLYENPEIGGEEFFAHELLTSYLEDKGFSVERNFIMETGFRASYGDPTSEVKIAFLAEYDALPEVGHGCGHNLFQGFSVLAALGIQEVIDIIGGQVLVIGTPAEENLGGKVLMDEAGVFNDLTACLMLHPSTENKLGSASSALQPLKFEFFGKSAHACHPEGSASALDAAISTYTSIQFQRQFMPKDSFIHGIVKHGGSAANVIPAYAALEYYFRAPTMNQALAMSEEATRRAQSSAQGHGCTLQTSVYECPYGDTVANLTLAEEMRKAMIYEGLENIQDFDWQNTGSTDVGAVSYRCPCLHAYIKIAEEDVLGHSVEMANATVSPAGHKALLNGAQALAQVAYTLYTNPEVRERSWQELRDRLEEIG